MGHDVYLHIITTPNEKHNRDPIRLRLTETGIMQALNATEFMYLGVSYLVERSVYSIDFSCLNLYVKAG